MPVSRRKKRFLLGCAFAAALSPTRYALSDTIWISNTSTNWGTAGNWSPAAVPTSATIVTFSPRGGIADPALDAARAVNSLNLANNPLYGLYTFSGNFNLTVGGTSTTGITNQALGVTSFNGPSIVGAGASNPNLAMMNIYSGAALSLAGTSVANSNIGAITLRGGSLILDNSAGNPASARLALAATTTKINLDGGGSNLTFLGNSAGSSFAVSGVLTVNSGDTSVLVNQPSGATGPTVVTFNSPVRGGIYSTINFKNSGSGILGGPGANDPAIKFTAGVTLANNVISDSSTTPGYAIYNGTDFAGYDTTKGVLAVSTTSVSGALTTSSPTQNSNLTANASIAAGATIAYNTLKISPSAANQSLANSGTLNTRAILLSGSTDYAINGGVISGGATRYIHVPNPDTSLSISSNLATAAQAINKAGDGFLVLTGGSNQVNFGSTQNFNLTGGTLRVTTTNFDLTTATAPTVRLRGGVLEYDVGAGDVSFTRTLGTGAGQVNWSQDGTADQSGGGGFSAYSNGADSVTPRKLTINLGGAVTWGSDVNFVQTGYALTFGSSKSNRQVIFDNAINLDGGTAGNYLLREVRVIGGVSGDSAKLNQAIAGSSSTDFFKTGTGTLILSAANTYAGNTAITAGTLALSSSSSNNNIGSSPKIYVASGANFAVSGITTSGGFKLAANQTLAGKGSVHGDFTAENSTSAVSPGDALSAGAITFTSTSAFNFKLTSTNPHVATGATLNIEIGGHTTAGTEYDQIIIGSNASTVSVNGATLAIVQLNGYSPDQVGRTYTIVNNQSSNPITGTFKNLADGAFFFAGLQRYQISYFGGVGSNDVVLTSAPEPSSLALLAIASGTLLLRKRRENRPGPGR